MILKQNVTGIMVMTVLSRYSSDQVPGSSDPQSLCSYKLSCNVHTYANSEYSPMQINLTGIYYRSTHPRAFQMHDGHLWMLCLLT